MTKRSKEKKKKSFVWIIIHMCFGAIIGGTLGPLIYGSYYDVISDGIIDIGKFIETYALEIYAITSVSIFVTSLVLTIIGRKKFMESVAREDEIYDEDIMSMAMGATGIAMMTSFIMFIPVIKVVFLIHIGGSL